jgi:RNA polymerase sigma-70 factor (ECF subfamily)
VGDNEEVDEPDPAAIRAAAAGDPVAFEHLVRAYQTSVWRYLRHFLGDPDLASDVTQDTFLRAFRRLDTFRHQSKFSTWLIQIARNAGIDAVRQQERANRLTQRVPPPRPVGDPTIGPDLADALSHLPAGQREPLLLVEVLGLTYREAAAVLSIPEGTAKRRVHDARQSLAEWWYGDERERTHRRARDEAAGDG